MLIIPGTQRRCTCRDRSCLAAAAGAEVRGTGGAGGDAPAPLPGQGWLQPPESASPSPGTASALPARGCGGQRARGSFGTQRRHTWVWGLGVISFFMQRKSGGGRRPRELTAGFASALCPVSPGIQPLHSHRRPLPHPRAVPGTGCARAEDGCWHRVHGERL